MKGTPIDLTMHDSAVQMFRERLLRKAYRPEKRTADCPKDVYVCEREFRDLLRVPLCREPMDRAEWHRLCERFSNRWEHICHWVHPSRLADHMTEATGLTWAGEFPPKPPPEQLKLKVKSNVKAQRFMCHECGIVCNSYAQYTIHVNGTRHHDAVQVLKHRQARRGRKYRARGATALDADGQVTVHSSSMLQAYFKREDSLLFPPRSAKPSESRSPSPSPSPAAVHAELTPKRLLSTSSVSESRPWVNSDGLPNGALAVPASLTLTSVRSDGDDERTPSSGLSDSEAESTPAPSVDDSALHGLLMSMKSDAVSEKAQVVIDRVDDALMQRPEVLPSVINGVEGDALRYVAAALLRVVATPGQEPAVLRAATAAVLACRREDLDEVHGQHLIARLSAGLQLIPVDDRMCGVESEHTEARNAREIVAYTATFVWGIRLYIVGVLSPSMFSTLLHLYSRNVRTREALSPPACSMLTEAFAELFRCLQELPQDSGKRRLAVPRALMPLRSIRTLYRTLAALATEVERT